MITKRLIAFVLLAGGLFGQQPIKRNMICVAASGSGTAYACNIASAPSAYTLSERYLFKADVANTGAATISFNGIGAVPIVKLVGGVATNLAAGDIQLGEWVSVIYDNTGSPVMQKQSIPQVVADWNAASGLAQILNKPTIPTGAPSTWPSFAGVATSGSYSDLSNKPTVPAAASTTPVMNGTAAIGSAATYAKADHVHPTDTSRQATITGAPGTWPSAFAPVAPTVSTLGGINAKDCSVGGQVMQKVNTDGSVTCVNQTGGGMADPGSNGLLKRTGINTTAVAIDGLGGDYVSAASVNNGTLPMSILSLLVANGITATGNIYANSTSLVAGCVVLSDSNAVHDMGLCAPSSGYSGFLNLPTAAGTLNQFLLSDGNGGLVFSGTAPTGAVVGTTDAQNLSNKVIDGVSATTMAFMDATSSIQTQLNTKFATANAAAAATLGVPIPLGCSGSSTANTTGGVTYLWPSGGTYSCASGTAPVGIMGIPMPYNCTVKSMYVKVSAAPATGSDAVTLYHNGTASAVTCSIGPGLSCNDTAHSSVFSAGDTLAVGVAVQASDAIANIRVGVSCQ